MSNNANLSWGIPFLLLAVASSPLWGPAWRAESETEPSKEELVNASDAGAKVEPLPACTITLGEAAARALLHSPTLAVFEWKTRAAEARIIQAGLRKNPELSVEVEDVRWRNAPSAQTRTVTNQVDGTGVVTTQERTTEEGAHAGFGEAQITLRLAQVVELGGKRVKRLGLAKKNKNLAQWDYETARLEVLTDVAKSFVVVWAAQERVDLARETAALAEQVQETVAARVKAGKVSPIEATKAEMEASTARIAVDQAVRDLDTARAELAATWGAESPDFDRVLGDLTVLSSVAPFDELVARIVKNPDLARWSDEMEAREATLKVERSLRIPDLTATVGFRTIGVRGYEQYGQSLDSNGASTLTQGDTEYSRDRDNSLTFEFSIPLPLFDRNQGGIKEAEYGIAQAKAEQREAETKAHTALFAAHKALSEACASSTTLRNDVLPRAQDVFDRTQRGYQQGKFEYLDVLDAQRSLFSVHSQLLDAIEAYHLALAEVERLTGAPLPDVQEAVAQSNPVPEESEHE